MFTWNHVTCVSSNCRTQREKSVYWLYWSEAHKWKNLVTYIKKNNSKPFVFGYIPVTIGLSHQYCAMLYEVTSSSVDPYWRSQMSTLVETCICYEQPTGIYSLSLVILVILLLDFGFLICTGMVMVMIFVMQAKLSYYINNIMWKTTLTFCRLGTNIQSGQFKCLNCEWAIPR